MSNIYQVVVRIDEGDEIGADEVTVTLHDGYVLETRQDQDVFVKSMKVCFSDLYGVLENGVYLYLLDEDNNEIWFD
jgi:hypothetical protein